MNWLLKGISTMVQAVDRYFFPPTPTAPLHLNHLPSFFDADFGLNEWYENFLTASTVSIGSTANVGATILSPRPLPGPIPTSPRSSATILPYLLLALVMALIFAFAIPVIMALVNNQLAAARISQRLAGFVGPDMNEVKDGDPNTTPTRYVESGVQTISDLESTLTQPSRFEMSPILTQHTEPVESLPEMTPELIAAINHKWEKLEAEFEQQHLVRSLLVWVIQFLPNFSKVVVNRLGIDRLGELSIKPAIVALLAIDDQALEDLHTMMQEVKADLAHIHATWKARQRLHDHKTFEQLLRLDQSALSQSFEWEVEREIRALKLPPFLDKRRRGHRGMGKAKRKAEREEEEAEIIQRNSIIPEPPETDTASLLEFSEDEDDPPIRLPPPVSSNDNAVDNESNLESL